jgi:glyoxylase-like metal-dependent hydrolase (beta-lactamase superfamily II)
MVEETGCASYLFGCPTHKKVGVVDPHEDLIDEYVETAKLCGCEIDQVMDTHVHADHRSGARALAERTGAHLRMPADSPVEFDYEPLRDDEEVVLGNTRVKVIHTPGHTWEHVCLLVTDATRGDDPWLVFTGDTLFVNAVGRPDLHGQERDLAAALRRSIQERLMTLPDWIELYPGHFGGSACGAGISSNPTSTIGFERRHNELLADGDDPQTFVDGLLAEQKPPPPEFAEIFRANQAR